MVSGFQFTATLSGIFKKLYCSNSQTIFRQTEPAFTDRVTITIDNSTHDSSEVQFIIKPVRLTDEGLYKCEITYLDVMLNCRMVQFTKLKTETPPTGLKILHRDDNGVQENVTNGFIGSHNEGTFIILTCETSGSRPSPAISWHIGEGLIL